MRYVIIGCGAIGMEMARRWTAAGHEVVGTTTSPERLDEVATAAKEAVLLDGSDAARIAEVAVGADAVVIAVSPRLTHAANRRERTAEYRAALIGTARNVAAVHQRLVLFSSLTVYGDGGPGDGPVDEGSPLTISLEPSAQIFGAAERVARESPWGVVIRIPWVSGHPRSHTAAGLLRMAHERAGGALPLARDDLWHRIDYRDAAAAGAFLIDHELSGVYNAVPDGAVPPRIGETFDRTADQQGLPRPSYTGEIRVPGRPVSSARLRAAGFAFTVTPDPEH